MCICKSVANCVISKHLRGTDITFAETSSLSLATAEQGAEPLTGGILIVCLAGREEIECSKQLGCEN